MKPTPRLLPLFLVFAAALFAGCAATQVAEADAPTGQFLGTVSLSGGGSAPPMGVLRSQLLDQAVRRFGRPAEEMEIEFGDISYAENRTIGRDIQYDQNLIGEDGSRYGSSPGGGWAVSARVSLKAVNAPAAATDR